MAPDGRLVEKGNTEPPWMSLSPLRHPYHVSNTQRYLGPGYGVTCYGCCGLDLYNTYRGRTLPRKAIITGSIL
jgi:hypothetical protein